MNQFTDRVAATEPTPMTIDAKDAANDMVQQYASQAKALETALKDPSKPTETLEELAEQIATIKTGIQRMGTNEAERAAEDIGNAVLKAADTGISGAAEQVVEAYQFIANNFSAAITTGPAKDVQTLEELNDTLQICARGAGAMGGPLYTAVAQDAARAAVDNAAQALGVNAPSRASSHER